LNIARFFVMFLVRPGGQAQFSHMLSHRLSITHKSRPIELELR
jgi:hypothetical protein